MKVFLSTLVLGATLLNSCNLEQPTPEANNFPPVPKAKKIIQEMTNAMGGLEKFKSLKNVAYKYTYRSGDYSEVSQEKYVFENEISWGQIEHVDSIWTEVQLFDGTETKVFANGSPYLNEKRQKGADFSRKTNYYWFAMMFKLLDPGLSYEFEGEKTIDDKAYDIVRINFNDSIGDVQDTYVMYINQETKLADRFLFTVMEFGRKEPLLMFVDYENHDGLQLPVYRKFTGANWNGDIIDRDGNVMPVDSVKRWNEEISENITLNNKFTRDDLLKMH